MVRKIQTDSDATIGQWIDSQNGMSDFMGDLDSLRPNILSGYVNNPYSAHFTESGGRDFIHALNYVKDPFMKKVEDMFTGEGATDFEKLEMLIDSAVFDIVRLEPLGESYGGTFPQKTSHFFASDAHMRDSYGDGDSPGSTGLINIIKDGVTYNIPSFDFDFYIESGGTFGNIRVDSAFDATGLESATFNGILIKDSAKIGRIEVPDGATITFGSVKINEFPTDGGSSGAIDSAHFHIFRTTNVMADSAHFKKATINNLIVEDKFNFDGRVHTDASQFLIKDDAGTNLFAAYKLDSV